MNSPASCDAKQHMRPYTPVPLTEDQKMERRAGLKAQLLEVLQHGRVTCECGESIAVMHAYKCFYCGFWFCPACARLHFAIPDHIQDADARYGMEPRIHSGGTGFCNHCVWHHRPLGKQIPCQRCRPGMPPSCYTYRRQKHHQLAMTAEMAVATWEGRKTQTRRLDGRWLKAYINNAQSLARPCDWDRYGHFLEVEFVNNGERGWFSSPFRADDVLWVREPAKVEGVFDWGDPAPACKVRYADGTVSDRILWPERLKLPFSSALVGKGLPNGVFREAARMHLPILFVRPERLQGISEEDARAEGVADREAFQILWDKLYAKRGLGWDANPLVWVLEWAPVSHIDDGGMDDVPF